jgi:hypothetical protein
VIEKYTFPSQASAIPEYFERKQAIPASSDKALDFALGGL